MGMYAQRTLLLTPYLFSFLSSRQFRIVLNDLHFKTFFSSCWKVSGATVLHSPWVA
jgi:hypothetical protein